MKELLDETMYRPGSYRCPDCWEWRLDCEHLVEALPTKRVRVKERVYLYAAFDRQRNILELGMHAGGTYQFFDVPLSLALGLVRRESGDFEREHIGRKFRFERVRVSLEERRQRLVRV